MGICSFVSPWIIWLKMGWSTVYKNLDIKQLGHNRRKYYKTCYLELIVYLFFHFWSLAVCHILHMMDPCIRDCTETFKAFSMRIHTAVFVKQFANKRNLLLLLFFSLQHNTHTFIFELSGIWIFWVFFVGVLVVLGLAPDSIMSHSNVTKLTVTHSKITDCEQHHLVYDWSIYCINGQTS